MYKKRLLKLADFLDKLPRRRFNFAHWVGKDWQGASDLSCGTTACAIGWATTMPTFRRLGLKLERCKRIGCTCANFFPATKENGDSAAVEEIFGIDEDEVDELFIPQTDEDEKATPKQVARRIRKFVARKEWEEAAQEKG